jgi:FAD-dependent urate hydroxylase
MTRALIVGGSVAGSLAAMALARAGIDAVVYEAHSPQARRSAPT